MIMVKRTELEFLKSLWGLGTEEEWGFRTVPPGYIGWANSFLGINSGAPYTFKSTGSVSNLKLAKKRLYIYIYITAKLGLKREIFLYKISFKNGHSRKSSF